jgi:hypothetical protein
MIPMAMGEEKMKLAGFAQLLQFFPQHPETGAAVNYQAPA